MKRILLVLLLSTYPLMGLPNPEPESLQPTYSWYFMIRALSLLFPYGNTQSLIINEETEERIPHQTARIFYSGDETTPEQ